MQSRIPHIMFAVCGAALLLFALVLLFFDEKNGSIPLLRGLFVAFGGAALVVYRFSTLRAWYALVPVAVVLFGLLVLMIAGMFFGASPVSVLVGDIAPHSGIGLIALFGISLLGAIVGGARSRILPFGVLIAYSVGILAGTALFATLVATPTAPAGILAGGMLAIAGFFLLGISAERNVPQNIAVAGIIFVGLSFFALASSVVLPALIVLHIFVFMYAHRRIRRAHVITAAAVLLFVFAGSIALLPILSASQSTIAPLDALYAVGTAYSKDQSTLFIGGTAFEHAWEAHRPIFVNSTPLWNGIFETSGVMLVDVLAAFGVVGALLMFGYAALMSSALYYRKKASRGMYAGFLAASVSAWIFIFGPPSFALASLAFFFGGFAGVGLMTHEKALSGRLLPRALTALGLIVAVSGFFYGGELALSEYAKGGGAGRKVLQKALSLAPHDDVARFLAEQAQQDVVEAIGQNTPPAEVLAYSEEALVYARRAVALNQNDMKNFVTLGSVQAQRAVLGITETAEDAVVTFTQARSIAPNHPVPALLQGRLFIGLQRFSEARDALTHALTLRPGYLEAQELLEYASAPPVGSQ